MPFKKGQSGNPSGRSKGSTDFVKAVQQHAKKALENICLIANNPEHPDYYKANQWLCERGHGKPSQALEVGGEGGGPIVVVVKDA